MTEIKGIHSYINHVKPCVCDSVSVCVFLYRIDIANRSTYMATQLHPVKMILD